ncbi:MAG: hypothetical protein AAGG44_18285, partial [Planctomycetota bacterium]
MLSRFESIQLHLTERANEMQARAISRLAFNPHSLGPEAAETRDALQIHTNKPTGIVGRLFHFLNAFH